VFQGALRLRDGKREFNPDHEQSVDKALRFLIGAVVIYVVGLVVGALVGFAMQTSIGGGPTNPAAQVQVDLVVAVVGGVFNLIFVILIALALEGFIERLMTQKGRAARNLFIGLSLLASFASMGLAVASASSFPVKMLALANDR